MMRLPPSVLLERLRERFRERGTAFVLALAIEILIVLLLIFMAPTLPGIDKGKTSRADLLSWVKDYDADGLSKHYKWDSTGELQAPAVYGYKVENGKIVPIGTIG